MKRLIIVLVSLLAFSISAYAQMDEGMKPEQKGQMDQGMMGGEGKMPMMHMCQEMMKQKMGEEQMPMCPMCMQMMKGHKEMMQTMMDMLKIQKKLLMGVDQQEKNELMNNLDSMIERMEKMMSDMEGMMCDMMKRDSRQKEGPEKKSPEIHQHKH